MKKIINFRAWMLSVFLGVITLSNGFAQQDPQYTQYMYNHAKINPAYAGSVDNLSIYGQYRTQWVGLEGAPKSVNASLTSLIAQSGLGLGVHFQNDKIGAMNSNTFAIDLSYTINLSWNYKLAFGVKGSGNILDVNYDKLHIFNPSDPVTQNNVNNKFSPNIGAGVFLYSEKAYVGFSIPALVSNTVYDANDIKTLKERPHYYLTGGYVFDFNQTWKLKPATLLKAVEGAPLQVDVSLNTMFKDKFTLGVAYRWDAAVSFLAGFQVDNTIFIGYSYDTDTTKLAHYNNGSHEIFMRFELFNSTKRTRSARFF